MSLFEMSLAGGAMVLAVVLARALLLNKLPKATFVVLWALVAIRLLMPVAVPSPVSLASLVQHGMEPEASSVVSSEVLTPTVYPTTPEPSAVAAPRPTTPVAPEEAKPAFVIAWDQVIPVLWILGSALCAGIFGITYLRCRREFRTALPVDHPSANAWLAKHQKELRRPLTLRQSDLVATPLTYGICKPVILVPKTCDWNAREQMNLMLAHELVHVRRFDAATKLILIACVCIHWFNPLVWVMYGLANRDLELSCDERVVRAGGTETRATYARTLIAMEETKSGLAPLSSGFSKTATKERIVAIMHIKKTSLVALATSASLIVGIPAALATSAMPAQDAPEQTLSTLYSTHDGSTITSKSCYSANDWNLVEALNVPDVENLTVEAFTDLALEVADTPEKRDRLIAILDDYAIYDQAPTSETASFVTNVLAPVLRENSRFSPTATELNSANTAGTDVHWSGATTFAAAEAVAGPSSNLEDTPTEVSYNNDEMGYWLNAHVLDASKITVGDYVQSIEDTRHAIDGLIGQDLAFSEQKNTGEKLTVALEDIAANQSSESLLMEAGWFVVSDTDGALTASNVLGTVAWSSDAAANNEDLATTELLAAYKPLGLSYTLDVSAEEYVLTMEFDGQPVRSIYDNQRGVWIANSSNEFRLGSDAVDLVTIYEGDRLVGLRENTESEQRDLDAQRATTLTTEGTATDAETQEPTAVSTVALTAIEGEAPAVPGLADNLNALNAQYEPYDLVYSEKTQSYLYQEKPVRYLFDGEVIDTNDDGTVASYATLNEYYDPQGTVDVYVVRATEYEADGSRNELGEIVDVTPFTAAQENLLASLIEGHQSHGVAQSTVAEETTAQESSAQGRTVAEHLEACLAYGLVYQNGNMTLNGAPVNAFVDMSQSGVFSYTSSTQHADGLYLRTVYNSNGKLTGLKEFDPATSFVEE